MILCWATFSPLATGWTPLLDAGYGPQLTLIKGIGLQLYKGKEFVPATWMNKEVESLLALFQKERSAADTLILVWWDQWQTTDLENGKTINLCCLKLFNLWLCVMAE